ncbi:MAG: HrpE/YscL family type III secretion apparatus protein [Simkaniaceae bacterium]
MKLFSLIKKGKIHLQTDRKVIPAEEFEPLLEAKEIIEKALDDAENYRNETKDACEDLRKKAQEEGFQEGLKQFNDHILKLDQEKRNLRHELQKVVLPLALKAAKKIVAKELETDSATIVNIVMQALKPVTQNHFIKIFVNKEDKEFLDQKKNDIRKILEHVESLVIEERSDIERGGCVIETEAGIINATLENQWRALEAAFEAFMKR